MNRATMHPPRRGLLALGPALLLAALVAGCGGGGGTGGLSVPADLASLKVTISWPANPVSDMVNRYTVTGESASSGNQKSVNVIVAGANPDLTPDGGWYTGTFDGTDLGLTEHGTYLISVQAHNPAGSSTPSDPALVDL
jgi:hypothetical protein